MDEQELLRWEDRFATRGPKAALKLTEEIRRLRGLLSPPASGEVVTGSAAVPVMIRENAEVGSAGEIGEAWAGG